MLNVLGTIAAVLLALVAGRAIHRRIVAQERSGGPVAATVSLGIVAEAFATLTVLLLAFVLVQTFDSFARARSHATDEASAVLNVFDGALVAGPAGRPLARSLACYGRAVATDEWDRLEAGDGASPLVERWVAGFRPGLALLAARGPQAAAQSVLTADRDRTSARRQRISQASPSVPWALRWLLILSVTATLVLFSAYVDRRLRPRGRVLVIGSLAVLLTLTILLIQDVDQPFAEPSFVGPNAMTAANGQMQTRLRELGPAWTAPCDASGRPGPA